MTAATFWVAIVLAAGAGVALAVVWMRARNAAQNTANDARTAAEAARPMADALARIEAQMREIESQRQHALGGLEAHLATLSKETVALSQALRGPNARGRWGELTLRRVAELSGMAPYCDFFEQQTHSEQGDRKRPDMLVKLPGGRTLAVDAKAPLAAYLDAEEAPDAAGRAAALDRHAQQLWRHVMDLSTREYWAQFDSAPEMVVLFLPGEHFMSAALERNRDLLESALAKKVLLATPVTLVSILKGVSYGWRQERLAKNAEELRQIAGEFHDRVRAFAEFYADSGRHLSKAIDAYNRSVASWDARLLPSLQRMRELGVGASAEPPQPGRIDTAARQPELPEDTPQNPSNQNPPHMMRELFLYLSRRPALRRWMEAWPPSRKVTRRFVAGDTLEEALEVCERLQREGVFSTLDHLGENVRTLAEASASCDAYVSALEQIAARGLSSTIAIKLTQFGLDLSREACLENVRRLEAKAKTAASRVEIDMESSAYTGRTLDLAIQAGAECGCVRVCVQAYLHRSAADIDRLNAAAVPVRMAKGAYREAPLVAFPRKRDVDENYVTLMKKLLDYGAYPAIATHDEKIIREAIEYVEGRGLGRDSFEFQMLYGIRRDLQRMLIERGYRLRLYVPYGTEWYPYFMRRLAERPANLWFVLKNLLK